jgi:hypothetical protein
MRQYLLQPRAGHAERSSVDRQPGRRETIEVYDGWCKRSWVPRTLGTEPGMATPAYGRLPGLPEPVQDGAAR